MSARACIRCKRPLRPAHSRAEDHPGTVAHHSHDHCPGCYRRLERGLPGPVYSAPRPCARVYDIDTVVIDLTIQGDRVPLNAAERRLVVSELTRRGMSTSMIARIVGCSKRHVTRLRSAPPLPVAHQEAYAA